LLGLGLSLGLGLVYLTELHDNRWTEFFTEATGIIDGMSKDRLSHMKLAITNNY